MDAANVLDAHSRQPSSQPRAARGIKHLSLLALTLLALAGIAYAVPTLERVRPWVKGEGVPVVRLFTGVVRRAELPQFEGAQAATAPGAVHGVDSLPDRQGEPPDEQLEAANLGSGQEVAAKAISR